MTLVRLEPAAPQSQVKHSTTEPLRSPKSSAIFFKNLVNISYIYAKVVIKLYYVNDLCQVPPEDVENIKHLPQISTSPEGSGKYKCMKNHV